MKRASQLIALILLTSVIFGCGGPIYAIIASMEEDDDDGHPPEPLEITTISLLYARNGLDYDETVQAVGGVLPYTWSITMGSLPSAVTLDPATGALSGTSVDTPGNYTFTLLVTDSAAEPATDTQGFTITLYDELQITYTTPLPDAIIGQYYDFIIMDVSGGTGSYTYTVSTGYLPGGLSFSSVWIWGTPDDIVGDYPFTVTVQDNADPPQTDTLDFTLKLYEIPAAIFWATPTLGTEPLLVTFTDASTGSITSWEWDFDNDTTVDSTVRNPTHTYDSAGLYTVRLSVNGPAGLDEEVKTSYILVDPAGSNTICVNGTSGSDASNGLSWAAAVKTIQRGIDLAGATGWTVLVADGTYTGTGNKNLDFTGKDIHLSSTTGPVNCIIDCEDSGRGLYFHSGETPSAIVEGFTILNGYVGAAGGGILCENSSSPIIRNCWIQDCQSLGSGRTDGGGAINCRTGSNPAITDCIMTDNRGGYAGAIECSGTSPAISNCIITDNWTNRDGGGIYCYSGASPTITDCLITDNMAQNYGGGGICCYDNSSATITNCTIANNYGDDGGGGVYCYNNCSVTIDNCTIANNSTRYGGAINCTLGSTATLNNTILWGNYSTAWNGHQVYTGDIGSTVTLNYCDYANGTNDVDSSGTFAPNNCITSDPLFVTPGSYGIGGGGDYHLQATSPCIDAGDDSLVPVVITTDLEGKPRIADGDNDATDAVDMGAYESNPYLLVPGDYLTIQSAIDAATNGDTVFVADGTYTGTGNKDLDFGGKVIYLKSEGGAAKCIIDCQNSGRGFYFHSGEINAAVVDGFTIRNGNVPGAGGGIHCESSSPTITNCTISNSTAQYGGGIRCLDSATPVIGNCTITGNTATQKAGGISLYNCSNPTVTNCVVSGNSAAIGAGGIGCRDSTVTITGLAIADNSAVNGAGIACNNSTVVITNCTVANNSAVSDGGGLLCNNDADATVNNTILWSNTAAAGNQIYTDASSASVTLNYCDYANGAGDIAGTGTGPPNNCINTDPLFVNGAGQNYHLAPTSPCIDIGDNSAVPADVTEDVEGNPRIDDGTGDMVDVVDIGAYECQSVLYVDGTNGDDSNDGLGWATAFKTIQTAFDSASSGYAIIVANGTYTGTGNKNLDFAGKAIYLRSLGDPTTCIIDCQFSGRGFHFQSGETSSSILEGFTIKNGYIADTNGGGIECYQSSPAITNCIITNNSAGNGSGGGIGCDNSSNPIITSCTITGNSADLNGGGIYCWANSSPTIVNCTIANNSASSDSGGGIFCHTASSPVITNCVVSNNAAVYGAGIYCYDNSNPSITNCTIADNSATYGGGICTMTNDKPTLDNSVLWENNATSNGNEIYTNDILSIVTLNYCDYANSAGDVGGSGTVTPTICISLDPLFVEATAQDYHLRTASPCIDAGDNSLVPAGITTDIEGRGRVTDGDDPVDSVDTVDIGAYEFQEWFERFTVSKPSARYDHAMAYDSNRGVVVLFGGYDGSRRNDTWEYDGTNWTDVSPAGTEGVDYPSARYMHAMAFDSSRNVVVLFGGSDNFGNNLNDTWEWNGTSWMPKSPVTSPAVRYNHAMAYDSARGVVVLFGGYGASNYDDTWEYNGTDWTQVLPVSKPSIRSNHAMAYDSSRGVCVLFGGYYSGYKGDTWEWNGTTWTDVSPGGLSGVDYPSARNSHAMVYDSNRGACVLFGGYSSGGYSDETWHWNGTSWVKRSLAIKPPGRQNHAMAYDSARKQVVLFGGSINLSPWRSDDTWEY